MLFRPRQGTLDMVIHIYYRHASMRVLGARSRPNWFSYARCFNNLIETSADAFMTGRAVLNVVYDGSEADFETNDVYPLYQQAKVAGFKVTPEVRFISGGDQRKAWRACLELVNQDIESGKVRGDDLIYLLENDYVHVPTWVDKIDEVVRSGLKWEYLTMYDHLDKYPALCSSQDASRYTSLKSQIYCTGSHHWRTTPSTCATYMLPVKVFLSDRKVLKLGIYDFKLFKILGHLRRRTLISPVPSLATHSMTEYLAPAVEWERMCK
jgi:hypothetical protein